MRRVALILAVALLVVGCGEDDEQPASPAPAAALADLRVVVDADGDGPEPAREKTVRCSSPEQSPLCEQVAALRVEDIEPAPRATACTEIYGGDQTATVAGTLRGERVDMQLSRVNGCEIARWDAARPLLG